MWKYQPTGGVIPIAPVASAPLYTSKNSEPEFSNNDDNEPLSQTEREQLINAMEKSGWVQAKAARLLNLTPRQMGYALRKYNIEVKRF